MYENVHSLIDDPALAQCFLALWDKACYLNITNRRAVYDPLDIQTIHKNQQDNTELLARRDKHSEYYFEKQPVEFQIICYSEDGAECKTKWHIALPKNMLKPTIK